MAAQTAGVYSYCRVGIPGEGFSSDFLNCTKYAMQEAGGLAGEERKRQLDDMFLVDPRGSVLLPGPLAYSGQGWEWVPASADWLKLARAAWSDGALEAVGVVTTPHEGG